MRKIIESKRFATEEEINLVINLIVNNILAGSTSFDELANTFEYLKDECTIVKYNAKLENGRNIIFFHALSCREENPYVDKQNTVCSMFTYIIQVCDNGDLYLHNDHIDSLFALESKKTVEV